jgi:outer membrane lipoprotein-sorting protein
MKTRGKDTIPPSELARQSKIDPKPSRPCLGMPMGAASLPNALAKCWCLLSFRVAALLLAVLAVLASPPLASADEVASAQTGSTVPSVETIVARMVQARAENRARSRPYIVTREYKLFGKERQATKSQVVADVTFVPPDSKKYTIQQINGSSLGKMIVGRMLAREAEITKDYSLTDISPDNYDFRFIREEDESGQRCYVLELLPRRKDKNLLRGNIWVDADTYLLRRTEGEPANTPSWWVRDVRIALRYGDVGGMWLQTASEATAHVRILGPCTMVSRDVRYKISEVVVVASASPGAYFNGPYTALPPH